MLCPTCQPIFVRPKSVYYERPPHQLSAQALLTSAQSQCQICMLLADRLGHDRLQRLSILGANAPTPLTCISEFTAGWNGPDYIEFHFSDSFLELPPVNLRIRPAEDIEPLISGHQATHRTDSPANWDLATRWIRTCVENHTRCRGIKDISWAPTRLLDLGPPIVQRHPRLCISESHMISGPYMTLSHCWGTAKVKMLLKSNLVGMCQLIPLDSLSKTFQDAIAVTKRFGVRYLWIDSLCIIQDSVEDWRQESALMGEVYKNSFLNIAATGAVDGTEGLFFNRNPIQLQSTRVEMTLEKAVHPARSVKLPFHLINHRPSWKEKLEEARLNCRAWVLQERILSPRVLHFGRQQIFWECRELEACEAYPGGAPKIPYYDVLNLKAAIPMRGSTFFQRGKPGDVVRQTSHRKDAFLDYWGSIVETYSRGSLTVATDKLIALSGIAQEAQQLLVDDYLAGLWRRTLLEELIWVADEDYPDTSLRFRPKEYRAPSWSWASLEGRISYSECLPSNHESITSLASIVDVQVTPIGDKTGQISAGFLKISGQLGLLRWVQGDDTSRGRVFNIVEITNSAPNPGAQSGDSIRRVYGYKSVRFDEFDIENPPPEVLFCISLFCSEETTRNVDPMIYGLLMTRTDQGEYKRVGRFDAMDEETAIEFTTFPRVVITII